MPRRIKYKSSTFPRGLIPRGKDCCILPCGKTAGFYGKVRDKAAFRRNIWGYYRAHGRDFPWRRTRDPYEILTSEFMLQQTQVSRVLLKYKPFLREFPDLLSLAEAPLRDVLAAWQGLGYNRRAVNLKRLAEIVMRDYGGEIPRDFETLKALPGIGQSTAGAVMAFAFNKPSIFIETNIRRVFIHFFFPRKKNIRDDDILKVMEWVYPRACPPKFPEGKFWREWYWALFDYGAMLGSPRPFAAAAKGRGKRDRSTNPNRRSAHYKKQSKFEGSRRQLRGEILRLLLTTPQTKYTLMQNIQRKSQEVSGVLRALVKENVIKKSDGMFYVV